MVDAASHLEEAGEDEKAEDVLKSLAEFLIKR